MFVPKLKTNIKVQLMRSTTQDSADHIVIMPAITVCLLQSASTLLGLSRLY